MKIISKYKDYYDYLSGIWGEDPKLILDRREFTCNRYRFTGKEREYVTLFICGYRIEGVYENGKFYYGEDISKIADSIYNRKHLWKFNIWSTYKIDYNVKKYVLKNSGRWYNIVLGKIVKDKENINERENCPIVIRTNVGAQTKEIYVEKFPVLKDLSIAKFLPAETIYVWLTDWLSKKETEKEIIKSGNLSNKNKIETKGFDKKRSFRPKMKN